MAAIDALGVDPTEPSLVNIPDLSSFDPRSCCSSSRCVRASSSGCWSSPSWTCSAMDRRVRGGSKGMWAVIIVFVNLIGPILYLLVGRVDGPVEDEAPAPGAMPGWGSPHDPPIVAPAGGRRRRDDRRPPAAAGRPEPAADPGRRRRTAAADRPSPRSARAPAPRRRTRRRRSASRA